MIMISSTPFCGVLELQLRSPMDLKKIILLVIVVSSSFAQESPSLRTFEVAQEKTSVRITLTLDREVTGTSGCFFDKLVFFSNQNSFRPNFPGICVFSNMPSSTIVGTMDTNDYINALRLEFLRSLSNSLIVIEEQPAMNFLPGISVEPVTAPLIPTRFTMNVEEPTLVSFDIDYIANRILLHFDSIMDITSYNRQHLFLRGSSSSQNITLENSAPPGDANLVVTLCIQLAQVDLTRLMEMAICQVPEACFCYFSSQLVNNYVQSSVTDTPPTRPMQVTLIRRPSQTLAPIVMRLSLSYTGCTALHTLAEDEVYVLRPNERITNINCSVNSNGQDSRPQISREGSLSGSSGATLDEEYFVYNWPQHASLNFSRGLPPQLYGQYICRSRAGSYRRAFVHDRNTYIEIPIGSSVEVRLYDPLIIPVFYGSYPRLNISQSDVEISVMDMAGAAVTEPTYNRINAFHVDIQFPIAQSSLSGTYNILIRYMNSVISRQTMSIEITDPIISVLPKVATVLPNQMEVTLTCTTNSDSLPVMWFAGDSTRVISRNNSYTVSVGPENTAYNCSIEDPRTNRIIASEVVIIRNVTDTLGVWKDGIQIDNNSVIVVTNRRSGDLNLECIEHVGSRLSNLTWFILPNGGPLIVPSTQKDIDNYTIANSGNQANLTIDNSFMPFRGVLKCLSSSGQVVNIRVDGDNNPKPTCNEDIDPTWKIQWSETSTGNVDFQPCPAAGGITTGVALRYCNENGQWNDSIDVTRCRSSSFIELENMAETMLFGFRNAYSPSGLDEAVSQVISVLNNITYPKSNAHFPMDLNSANNILQRLIMILVEENLPSNHTDLIDAFNNLLNMNNDDGWRQIPQMNYSSQRLLNNSEVFGIYLMNFLRMNNNNPQPVNELSLSRDSIAYSALAINHQAIIQDIIFPANFSRGAQITLPANLLRQQEALGAVNIVIKNLDSLLPAPTYNSSSNTVRIASNILSSQILTPNGTLNKISSGSASVFIEFETHKISRATSPECVFWNESISGMEWSLATKLQEALTSNGEFKQYKVRCSSTYLTAFAIAANVDTSRFSFSIPVYIGLGFVIFSCVLSMFSILLSWACDNLRRYSTAAFLIHLSFVASLFCAYIAFLAGILEALDNRIGCAAVAGLLHYFFTATFTWLLCEGLLLIFFASFSLHAGLFCIIFLIGWGIPAIPTAISLGVLHETYGTTTHCWFFFDGQISSEIVLAFIIPKLVVIAVILLLLAFGCCTICCFDKKKNKKKLQPDLVASLMSVMWLIWASILISVTFLAAAWVFALLLVNVYGLDSSVLGWIFMAASIILGLWLFIFSFATMILNQKVDYERLWHPTDPVYPPSDPGRGKGYEFMTMSSDINLTGRRRSSLMAVPPGPPVLLSNPVFGEKDNK